MTSTPTIPRPPMSAVMPPAQAAIRHPGANADPAQVEKAAKRFEAMAIGQLLEPIFKTVDMAHGLFGGGAGEQMWWPMLVQAIAKQIEARGGLGLAKPIYEAMMQAREGGKPE